MIISEIELTPKKVLKVHLDNVNGVRFGHIRIWAKNNYFQMYFYFSLNLEIASCNDS